MIEEFELLEQEGHTYKAIVRQRASSKWMFWDKSTKVTTYIGNTLGWYDPSTGAQLKDSAILTILSNEMRRQYLQKMLVDQIRSKMKPVK